MFFVADDCSNLVRLKLRNGECSYFSIIEPTTKVGALSSQRLTVFQPIRFTRAIADLFRPSTLSVATSSKVARRCWSRW